MPSWAGERAYWADVEAIELAFIGQWAVFGQGPLGEFHRDDAGLTWTAAPVPQLPYNAVLHSRIGSAAAERVAAMVETFRQRGVQFMWLVHPTSEPAELARLLDGEGLALVERSTGMSLDLARWRSSERLVGDGVSFAEVVDEAGLVAYESLIADYWELAPESRDYVVGINRWTHSLGHGRRVVAYREGRPVGKAYLSLNVGPDTYSGDGESAAVFGVYVAPEARRLGIAEALMEHLLELAADLGRRRVVLHSSEAALPLYLRMGFAPRCALPVYATTSLHSLQPS